jgi:hypothetical protein
LNYQKKLFYLTKHLLLIKLNNENKKMRYELKSIKDEMIVMSNSINSIKNEISSITNLFSTITDQLSSLQNQQNSDNNYPTELVIILQQDEEVHTFLILNFRCMVISTFWILMHEILKHTSLY